MKGLLLFWLVFVGFLLFGCTGSEVNNVETTPTAMVESVSIQATFNSLTPTQVETTQTGCEKAIYDRCSKITDPEKRDQCFNGAGRLDCCFEIVGGQQELVEYWTPTNGTIRVNASFRDRCLLNKLTLAVYDGEKRDFCARLEGVPQELVDWCYKDKYARWLGSEWCDKIKTTSLRDDCYLKTK